MLFVVSWSSVLDAAFKLLVCRVLCRAVSVSVGLGLKPLGLASGFGFGK